MELRVQSTADNYEYDPIVAMDHHIDNGISPLFPRALLSFCWHTRTKRLRKYLPMNISNLDKSESRHKFDALIDNVIWRSDDARYRSMIREKELAFIDLLIKGRMERKL